MASTALLSTWPLKVIPISLRSRQNAFYIIPGPADHLVRGEQLHNLDPCDHLDSFAIGALVVGPERDDRRKRALGP